MTVTLVLPKHIADELFQATAADVETAGVLLARHAETPGGDVRLLARGMHWVPDDAYRVREAAEMSIASHGYVPALAAAEADQSVPIWLHTHPGNASSPRPSKRDEIVDEELADPFRLRSGSPVLRSSRRRPNWGASLFYRPHRVHPQARRHQSPVGNWAPVRARSELAPRDTATAGSVRPEHSRLRRGNSKSPRRPARRHRRLRRHRVGGYRATRAPSVCATSICSTPTR